ncbi:MAG: hypothetical protein M1834_002960 [Cirrosporium novae-zelandiae]|nr:MAG: hypothetical protein M1834_002960 [Cirrosporium novae-zelandiae]
MKAVAISLLRYEKEIDDKLCYGAGRIHTALGATLSSYFPRLCRISLILLPSYVQRWIRGEPHEPTKLHPTSALDGLRGCAAVVVFIFHFVFTFTWTIQLGYGFQENWWIILFPFIRLFHHGMCMVLVFFFVSGYVISYKPLMLMQRGSWDLLLHTLASSAFRRAFRLFIPSIVATLIVLATVRMGFWEYPRQFAFDGVVMTGVQEPYPPRFPTLSDQLTHWGLTLNLMTSCWHWDNFYPEYDPHLWTIPVEYRSSLVLFLVLLALAKCRVAVRLALLFAAICYCIHWDRWEIFLFLSGMFIAQVDLILLGRREKISTPNFNNANTSNHYRWTFLFILGAYLMSSPNIYMEYAPGYKTLHSLAPSSITQKHRFIQSIGVVLLIHSLNNHLPLQRPFLTPIAQYLGKISYSFYIVHGPILHTLHYSLMPSIWAWTGREQVFGYVLGYLMSAVVCIPIVLWAADLFWRGIDVPTVRFARWVEQRCFVRS